jgi:Protein of unknown function (DUF3293)
MRLLNEISLTRMWQHIQSDRSFAMMSPFIRELSLDENLDRYQELKNTITSLQLKYIEMGGGYTYKDKDTEKSTMVEEMSVFIPNISFDTAIMLGNKFDQQTIIYKDNKMFSLVNPKTLEVWADFHRGGAGQTFTFRPKDLEIAYSQFLKTNPNSRQSFAFRDTSSKDNRRNKMHNWHQKFSWDDDVSKKFSFYNDAKVNEQRKSRIKDIIISELRQYSKNKMN